MIDEKDSLFILIKVIVLVIMVLGESMIVIEEVLIILIGMLNDEIRRIMLKIILNMESLLIVFMDISESILVVEKIMVFLMIIILKIDVIEESIMLFESILVFLLVVILDRIIMVILYKFILEF